MKKNLSEMTSLDLYLSNLSPEEYKAVKSDIQPSNSKKMPLDSWDIFSDHYFNKLKNARRETDIKRVEALARKFNWKNELDEIFRDNEFEALIVTDWQQQILWVNQGFTKMTGYSKDFSVNQTPRFLQGVDTSEKTTAAIKHHLEKKEAFEEVILNYKKDQTPYWCEVKIFPLYTDKITHYIALENEIR